MATSYSICPKKRGTYFHESATKDRMLWHLFSSTSARAQVFWHAKQSTHVLDIRRPLKIVGSWEWHLEQLQYDVHIPPWLILIPLKVFRSEWCAEHIPGINVHYSVHDQRRISVYILSRYFYRLKIHFGVSKSWTDYFGSAVESSVSLGLDERNFFSEN